jgi:hypothetical protein
MSYSLELLDFIRAVVFDSDMQLGNKMAGDMESSTLSDLSNKAVYRRKMLSDSSPSSGNFHSEKGKYYIPSDGADELTSEEAEEVRNHGL